MVLELLPTFFHCLYHVEESLLSSFVPYSIFVTCVGVQEHELFYILGYRFNSHFLQMLKRVRSIVQEHSLHFVIVMNVELEPAGLLQVYFHCVVLELGGIEILTDDVASRQID